MTVNQVTKNNTHYHQFHHSMSFSALQAVKLAQKAREAKKTELELAIDADVQKLRAVADKRMMKVPDEEGYYIINIEGADIDYDKPKIVIDRFCEHMESLGFIVPQVKCRNSWSKKKSFMIRFRPSEDAIRQASESLESDVPSSNSSAAS